MTDKAGFVMESDTMGSGFLRALSMFETGIRTSVEETVINIVDSHVSEVESFMKEKARWQDVTGAAREQLAAQSFHEPSRHTIVAYQQVPYGGWLEVNWNGKYGIILLTIESSGEDLMSKVTGMLSRMSFSHSARYGTGWAILS